MLAEAFVASAERPLPLQMRPDLVCVRQSYQGKLHWVIKDPLALDYFRLREEEYAVLSQLDGRTSLNEIKQRFDSQFAPRHISLAQLHGFVGQLHQMGLILAPLPGQGDQLMQRSDEKTWRKRWAAWSNILCFRFRGVDPQWVLDWLNDMVGWVFSRWFALLALMFILSAVALVSVHFAEFQARLPEFHSFFQAENAIWLAVALAVTKIIHELGHGLACRRFGGECHEIGVMLLVGTPCLYCNVSDSWLLPSKWQRAAIGAGGMYVELILAAACTWLWWFSEPGLLNYLCLNVMFVSSVSTLIFNANPLLRYDGYYILTDLLEIPNLAEKSQAALRRVVAQVCLGLEPAPTSLLPQRWAGLMALYTVASAAYRWFVLFSILWFLNKVFEPYKLDVIGQTLSIIALWGLVAAPLWQAAQYFSVPGRMGQVKKLRVAATVLVLIGIAAAIWYVPIPNRVFTTLVLEPRDAVRVWVDVPGELAEVFVKPGDEVAVGAPLARLKSPELDYKVLELQGKRDEQRIALRNLRRQQDDPNQVAQIPSAEQALKEIEEQLRSAEADAQRLNLAASAGGMVLPPPVKTLPPTNNKLPTWSGIPLDPDNLGTYLSSGELLCLIGDPQQLEALLVVDQADVDFVARGQRVQLELDELPGQTLTGEISELAHVDLAVAPRQLATRLGGELDTRVDAAGNERPLRVSYLARVPLSDPSGRMLPGLRGRAKIAAGETTLGRWLLRTLSETFHFQL